MKQFLMLLLATFIWGLGFVGTRWTLVEFSPTWSNTVRYLIAAAVSLVLLRHRKKALVLKDKGALICAICLASGLQLQTVGIAYTTMAKSGFLTVFYALFTPVICMIFYKQKYRFSFWVLLALALFGIALLCELEINNFNRGDFFILASAVAFSFHIISVDRYGRNRPSFEFNLAQCIYAGVISLGFGFVFDQVPESKAWASLVDFSYASPMWGFLIVAFFSSIVAFGLQVEAQKKLSAHIVGLIFLMESIFCAFFGYIFFEEKLSVMAMVGAVLVLTSVALIPRLTRFQKSAAESAA